MAKPIIKRQTAYLVKIEDLLKAQFVQGTDDVPGYFFLPERELKVVRINCTGIVISNEDMNGFQELVIDDASGGIPIRNFDASIKISVQIGDIVRVIAKVRDYNEQRYLLPEVVKKLDSPKWLTLRNLEILATPTPFGIIEKVEEKGEHVLDEHSPKQKVYELVKELDKGEGVNIIKLQEKSNLENFDNVVRMLIEEGEIFKIAADRVKVL